MPLKKEYLLKSIEKAPTDMMSAFLFTVLPINIISRQVSHVNNLWSTYVDSPYFVILSSIRLASSGSSMSQV